MKTTTNKNTDIEKFLEEIKKDKTFKKNIYDDICLSGCSTYVHPITISENEIIFQWKSNKKIFDKFIERYTKQFPQLIKSGVFDKGDGSCPSQIIFYLKIKNN